MAFRRIGSINIDLDFIECYIPRDVSLNTFQLIIYRKNVQDPIVINFITAKERDDVVDRLDKNLNTVTLT